MTAWLRLVRAGNLVILGAAILLGYALAGGGDFVGTIPALLAAVFLVAAFYIGNDVADLSVDRVNRADRPLPFGGDRREERPPGGMGPRPPRIRLRSRGRRRSLSSPSPSGPFSFSYMSGF